MAAALRGAGLRRDRVARGVARVPRVRAHGHHRGQRLPAPGRAAPTCAAWPALADEVLVMTSAGGLVPVEAAAERPAALLLTGPAGGVLAGGRGRGRQRLPRRHHLRHGRHQHRRVPRARRAARAGGRARGRRASRCGCRRSTCTPSAPAAGRSPAIDAGGALRGRARAAPAPCPGRPATAAAAPSRR